MDQSTVKQFVIPVDDTCLIYNDVEGWSLHLTEDEMIDLYFQLKEYKCYA